MIINTNTDCKYALQMVKSITKDCTTTFIFLSLYICRQCYWYHVTVSLPDQDGRFMSYFVQIKRWNAIQH